MFACFIRLLLVAGSEMFCSVDAVEENEERMMVDPSSREDPKVKELLQVNAFLFIFVSDC